MQSYLILSTSVNGFKNTVFMGLSPIMQRNAVMNGSLILSASAWLQKHFSWGFPNYFFSCPHAGYVVDRNIRTCQTRAFLETAH